MYRKLTFVVLALIGIFLCQNTPAQAQDRFWIDVSMGNKNTAQNKTIQYLLRAQGYQIGVDGVFGRQTKARVAQFQSDRDSDATGIVDTNTWEELVITVKRGSRGDAVRAAQTMLKGYWKDFENSDYRKVVVDGVFGPQFESQIKKFQRNDAELSPNGIVGMDTWAVLTACEH